MSAPTSKRNLHVATDVGGTFTDLVYLDADTGEVGLAKASTTPPNFEQGVVNALDRAGIDESVDVSSFAHGTTVIINALTERKGSRTGLVTTRGFRDILEMTRANRPALFDLRYEKPAPFVKRASRFEVSERVDFRGEIITPLEEDEVRAVAVAAKAAGIEALAICFLHSYANTDHERRCAEILREELPDVAVTMSHEISMEWREYERSSTAVLNAYVQEVAARYLNRLGSELDQRGIERQRFVMQSSGGMTTFDRAKERPITLIESGPVAGIMGAAMIGRTAGRPNVISLDIGGTTAKTSLIEDGAVKVSTNYRIEQTPESPGHPIQVPVVDIVEIGAGGGSIASIDDVGGLHVGPHSAGAVPGPACYGRGGDKPTVTDANLITGRLDPKYFLGGELEVSVEAARTAMKTIAEPLGVSIEEAALGVIRVANASMVNALKLVSVRRGHDPRDFDLIATGGGGSMHATSLASELHIKRVIVPPSPGHFSAWGMLMTEQRADWVRTRVAQTDHLDFDQINEIWRELEELATEFFESGEESSEGLVYTRSADMRFKGQEHTVKVPLGAGPVDEEHVKDAIKQFVRLHERHYTFSLDVPIEYVNFHLTALRPRGMGNPETRFAKTADRGDPVRGHRLVHFAEGGQLESTIYQRDLLEPGTWFDGPAVVQEPAASTLILPDQHFMIDEWANLVIES